MTTKKLKYVIDYLNEELSRGSKVNPVELTQQAWEGGAR